MASQETSPEVRISAREAEVLSAVGEHLTNAEIGARLFISSRTVESHVASLLRKLQVDDRRALATLAANLRFAPSWPAGTDAAVTGSLPSPLTPFVGRATERAALAAALHEQRLVTAVGPGGVGKTRLALSVAADANQRFADGVWFVDLVPVTDPLMIAPAIADALGLGEGQGRSATDNVLGWLAGRETLLVLDNCEHLLDGVTAVLERLLAGSPRLTVLATSRARLLVPFEWVFAVPGLSVDAGDDGPPDAVELFVSRAAAAGSSVTRDEQDRIADVCRGLDGSALAIELAAARYPSLGLHGLEAGLADRLRLLTGGSRINERHRSLRSTLDWSNSLLAEPDQAVLRRVSVFAGSFTAAAAEAVLAAWAPVPAGAVPTILAGLADHSLLIATAAPTGTRYRALETIRQYGAHRLDAAGERIEALSRHLAWCMDESETVLAASRDLPGSWRAAFDDVASEIRSALAWAADDDEHRAVAYRLAIGLAELTFVRGMPGESQRRYEQAAELAPDDLTRADALRSAAGAAECRHSGDEGLQLRRAAADIALRAGDPAAAAGDLARNAEFMNRSAGLMAARPDAAEVDALIAEGWALAGSDRAAEARLLIAEAFNGTITDPATVHRVERGLMLARDVGDPLIESAALALLTLAHLARGEVSAAVATASRRTDLLAPNQIAASSAYELFAALGTSTACAVAAGDLHAARRFAERLKRLPFYREEGHLATRRLLVVTMLAGDWDETIALAERFREGWEGAGRPRVGNLSRSAHAVATVHGLRGDDDARRAWLDIVDAVTTPDGSATAPQFGKVFDAMVLVHRGLPQQAVRVLDTAPEELADWRNGGWHAWYAALWAEATVMAGHADVVDRVDRARRMTVDNPIAAAIVDRAAVVSSRAGPADRRARLTVAAAAFADAGCRYQWARTLVLIGGEQRERGELELATMGAAPMVWPSVVTTEIDDPY